MKERSFMFENNVKKYLFKGDFERFKQICSDLGIIQNLKGEFK